MDQNIKDQQNLAALPIAIAVFVAQSNTFDELLPLVPGLEKALQALQPKTLVEIHPPAPGVAQTAQDAS